MPKIIHVARAQQRYETKPVLDEEGQPVKIHLFKNGQPQMTRAKGGRPARPVFITKTVRDLEHPKPMPRCDYPGCEDREIKPGTAYKHMTTKNTYGGTTHYRHAEHRNWYQWEYSYSTAAMVAQVAHDHNPSDAQWESVEDAEADRDAAKEAAEALLEEKQGNLGNLPDALQETGELYDQVQALEAWVEEFDSVDFEEFPEAEAESCEACAGTGKVDNPDYDPDDEDSDEEEEIDCEACDGDGEVTADDPSDEQVEEWREGAREALQAALDACEL